MSVRLRYFVVIIFSINMFACITSTSKESLQTMNSKFICNSDSWKKVGDFKFCLKKQTSSYQMKVAYTKNAPQIYLNGKVLDKANYKKDRFSKVYYIEKSNLKPGKYSYLFKTSSPDDGVLFVPIWIGNNKGNTKYESFSWKSSFMYQILTDRFFNGDVSNDIDNSKGDLIRVQNRPSMWQGGDFAGIIKKIDEKYFLKMGVNTIWISSPILNSHSATVGPIPFDPERYSSYHSYHPVATGYSHFNKFGYKNPIETAFGSSDELKLLVNKAHEQGIRIVADFVVNHVHKQAAIYKTHPEWFFDYLPCGVDDNWNRNAIKCWMTKDLPDINYDEPAAVKAVTDHAIWMIHEFNLDGFRIDAIKHTSEKFITTLKKRIVSEVETTNIPFYIIGESLGGDYWVTKYVAEDMLHGQVNDEFFSNTRDSILTNRKDLQSLKKFAHKSDSVYRNKRTVMPSARESKYNLKPITGGYKGAIMGNFIGNHDYVRPLTYTSGNYDRFLIAQTFIMTSPNIPMLYQGDDIGMKGDVEPDNRKMMKFGNLTEDEKIALNNISILGKTRAEQRAITHGLRSTILGADDENPHFWVYKMSEKNSSDVYVAINLDIIKQWTPPAGYDDVLGNCKNSEVQAMSSCVFVKRK